MLQGASAQLIKVDQTVYGMDCAPCAYGLEAGLKRIDGVANVKVSLNEGKAHLSLVPDNTLTLQRIQTEIKQNGFSAREAEILLQGTLVEEPDNWVIKNPDESYRISEKSDQTAFARLREEIPGTRVKVKGKVAHKTGKTAGPVWELLLVSVE